MSRLGSWPLLLVLALLVSGAVCGETARPGKQALRDLLVKEVLKEPLAGRRAYVAPRPLRGSSYVTTWRTKFQVPASFSRAWFYFVDDMPQANWEHPCRYVFVDVKTHAHVILEASTPPTDVASMIALDHEG